MFNKSLGLVLVLLTSTAFSKPLYCPNQHTKITLGISIDEFIKRCGEPLSKEVYLEPLYQKLHVQRLFYNNKKRDINLQSNVLKEHRYEDLGIKEKSLGVQYEVDTIKDIIVAFKINDVDSETVSFCGHLVVKKGDPIGRLYGSCGLPAHQEEGDITQKIESTTPNMVLTYHLLPSQKIYQYIFLNEKLFLIKEK